MAEDYAYACQRAELLDLPPPTEEEWAKTRQVPETETGRNEEQEIEDATVEDLEMKDEGLQRVGGGLDELTSILSATQKKLNRFKTVCGSLGTLLKVRVNSRGGTPNHAPLRTNSDDPKEPEDPLPDETISVECPAGTNTESEASAPRQHDINAKVESHIDKLDLLISKAENAQYSMQHQSKQMKKFLN